MYTRIVAPLDGTPFDESTLPAAEAQARLAEAPLHLLRVVTLTGLVPAVRTVSPAASPSVAARVLRAQLEIARSYVDELARACAARAIAVTTEVRCGAIDQELVAALRPGDLVVAAFSSPRAAKQLTRGMASDIIVRSPASLLWVRHDPPDPPAGRQGGGLARERRSDNGPLILDRERTFPAPVA